MRVVVLRLWAIAALLAVNAGLAGCGPQQNEAESPRPVTGPVVVLTTAGLTWDDISTQATALPALLDDGAVATLVPRSLETISCPVDGALAVSAGRRADAARQGEGCRAPMVSFATPGAAGIVQGWTTYLDRAAEQGFDARPGALGAALAGAGRRSAALGPLSAVTLAEPNGTVPRFWPDLTGLPQALATGADLVVADLPLVTAATTDPDRPRQVATLDAVLGEALNVVPDDATVLVASIADAADAETTRLQLVAMVGPAPTGPGSGLLRSPSTRQDALVQTVDVLPTLLAQLGVAIPDQVDGAPLRPVRTEKDAATRLERLLDLQQAAAELARLRVTFFLVLLAGLAAVAAAFGLWLRTRPGPPLGGANRGARAGIQVVALVAAAVPAGSVLTAAVPWWRAEAAGAALVGIGLVASALVAAAALAGPWRRHAVGPPAVVAVLSAAVLTADAAAGSPLTLITPMGGDPLVGGRFYGFHNPLFAVYGSAIVWSGLGLATLLAVRDRRRTVPIVLVVLGLAASVVNVLPTLGADVGGPPALLPAMALLALRAAGVRLTWVRATEIAAVTATLLTLVFVADWLRPAAERTHLGRFVQTLLAGGAGNVLRRKVSQNLEILTSSPATMAIPVLAVGVAWALARPQRFGLGWVSNAYRRHWLLADTLAALGVLALLGFAANDSGTSIPPAVALISLPLLLAICAATPDAATRGAPPRW